MSIVFSVICPHPPLIIPEIGKENRELLKNTINSFEKLKNSLKESKPDSILVISPHGERLKNSFSLNLSPNFNSDFEDFGVFSVKETWQGDIALAYKIKESLETSAPLQLINSPKLDYGTAIPLLCLETKQIKSKIIPLYYSDLSNEAHFKFGQILKKELLKSKNRIAIIASGDLSHRLTQNAPGGYSPKGKKFDKKVQNLLQEEKISEFLNLKKDLIAEAGECGLRSILILLGILDKIKYKTQILSYEAPFGVGYLTVNFKF